MDFFLESPLDLGKQDLISPTYTETKQNTSQIENIHDKFQTVDGYRRYMLLDIERKQSL